MATYTCHQKNVLISVLGLGRELLASRACDLLTLRAEPLLVYYRVVRRTSGELLKLRGALYTSVLTSEQLLEGRRLALMRLLAGLLARLLALLAGLLTRLRIYVNFDLSQDLFYKFRLL
jgi:hypothetical protein